jgi:hypothetical protein
MPATRAPKTRKPEKKRARKTALPPCERYGIPKVEVPPLDQDASGKEYGLPGQRHPGALQHHPEEDDQVTVVLDEGEDPVHS